MSCVSMKVRYEAAMVLSGVGDAMGYRNGSWEFCHSGELIHDEAAQLGGVEKIRVKLPGWPISDDTVLHLATAEALAIEKPGEDREQLYARIADNYKIGMRDMNGRAPGPTTMSAVHALKPGREKGYQIAFDARGGGCGAAMRSMCIGLRYPRAEELDDLIAVGVESGRMTHHHPTGYLGSVASALFTSYSIQDRPLNSWGVGLVKEVLPKALDYIQKRGYCVKDNVENWEYFHSKWEAYLDERGISDGKSDPHFPEVYGVKERDKFYKSLSFSGWGGASGHDAPMIAYDALLSSRVPGDKSPALEDWAELCSRSMFHSGDSDSTGVIAACCYGAMFGFQGVPEGNYKDLEYAGRLRKSAAKIYSLSHPDASDADKSSPEDESIPPLPSVPTNEDLENIGGAETSQDEEQTNMDVEATPEAVPSTDINEEKLDKLKQTTDV